MKIKDRKVSNQSGGGGDGDWLNLQGAFLPLWTINQQW